MNEPDNIEALRADARRIDWLADKNNHIGNVQLPTMCVMNHLDSLRDAIDEAMQIDPTTWGEIGDADPNETFGQEHA